MSRIRPTVSVVLSFTLLLWGCNEPAASPDVAADTPVEALFPDGGGDLSPDNLSTADPSPDPSPDPAPDPSPDPTPDPVSDPTPDPVADPSPDPTADPVSDPTPDPVSDPTADPTPDLTADLGPDLTPDPGPDAPPPTCVPDCAGKACGFDGCDGLCGGVSCPAQPSLNTRLTILGHWYLAGDEDSLLTANAQESPGNGTFNGALAYALMDPLPNSTPLYRLFNGLAGTPNADHMPSVVADEGAPSYSSEGTLAHLPTSPFPGSAPLTRYFRASPTDHDAGFSTNPPAGYAEEFTLGHVIPRFGTSDVDLVTVSGAEVDLSANRVAGGSIWELTWNGEQMINDWDFGRQLQIAFQVNGVGEDDNPTEAGDSHAKPSDPAGWRHGAPVTVLEAAGTTLTTECFPLQWKPELFIGGASVTEHPVAWTGTIGKTVELDYGGDPHILKWTTTINFPQDQGILNIELATAYLNGNFTRFYAYDASTGTLIEKTAVIPNPGCVDPSEDPDQQFEAGGVIITTGNGSHAMGVYRNRPLNPVEGYGLCSFLVGNGTGPADNPTTKWNILERPIGGLAAGTYDWELFLVVGTLSDATAAMDALYAAGD